MVKWFLLSHIDKLSMKLKRWTFTGNFALVFPAAEHFYSNSPTSTSSSSFSFFLVKVMLGKGKEHLVVTFSCYHRNTKRNYTRKSKDSMVMSEKRSWIVDVDVMAESRTEIFNISSRSGSPSSRASVRTTTHKKYYILFWWLPKWKCHISTYSHFFRCIMNAFMQIIKFY